MTWIKVLLWLVPRRAISSWSLLSVVSFGILASVTLMAVGMVYSKTLAEGGIRHTLVSVPQTSLNAQVAVQKRPLGPADYQRLRGVVEDIIDDRLGYMVRNTQRSGRSQSNLPLVLNLDGRVPSVLAPLGQPFFLTDFEKHTNVIEGRWPHGEPLFYDNGVSVEMVVGRQTASVMGWDVGEQVYLIPFAGDPSQSVSFTLVGLVEPIDPEEEYWMASATYYFNAQDFDPVILAPMYMPEDAFFDGLGTKFPSLLGDYWWYLFLDTGVITADMAGPTKEAIVELEKDLSRPVPRSVVFSLLERTIEDYQRELSLANTSLFLFLSLVVVVILYFLVLVLELLSRKQSDAANILRSRGANMLQVGGFFVLGESCIVLVSTILGPFLAVGIVRYLLVKTITPVEGSTHLPVELSPNVFLVGAIGGLLSLAVLSVSGISIARLGTVEFLRRRVRPPTVPILHRYYVDILVLAVFSLIWWQIENRGGFTQRDLGSSRLMEVDLSMLLGPALVLLATAFLIFRLLPLLMTFLAWTGGFMATAWVSFALMRMSRDPLPHGSLVVMLTMATALGMFGATFQSTISRSQEEQVLYRIGGDLVIGGSDLSDSIREELEMLPGVLSASPVVRMSSTLLGVDPYSLHTAAWFRDDFADKPLSELLKPLIQEKQGYPGIVLPYDTESIGLWLRLDNTGQTSISRTLFIRIRVAGSSGIYRTISLGELSSTGSTQGEISDPEWVYFEALLPEVLKPPFSLVSIFIHAPFGSSLGLQPGSISVDDVTVNGTSSLPGGLVVEDYEESTSSSTWVTLPNFDSGTDRLERRPEAAKSGQFGLTFSWNDALGDSPRGILAPAGPIPIPAVGGSMFDVGQKVRVESENRPVPVVLRSVTDYFPSIIQPDRPFLLINNEDYENYMSRMPGYGGTDLQKQFWVSLNDSFSHNGTVRSIKRRMPDVSIQYREAAVELAQNNPLLGSSWTGLTILSMFALTIAVAITLSTYSVISIQMDRIDLTIARALGFSRMELFLALALEKVLVAILGMCIGSAVGIWLSQWVLNFLDGTIGTTPTVPPTIFTIDNGLIALVYISLGLSSSIAILAAVISALRLDAPDILRSG